MSSRSASGAMLAATRALLGSTATALALAGTLVPHAAHAQPYPAKPVRFIVPFPPGGGVDTVARTFAERITVRIGQSVVVDNRPRAGTTIGAEAAARSAPDGYTFLLAPIGSQAIVHLTFRKLSFDVMKDLVPVARIGYGTIALVVPANSKATSAAELVATARAQPGRLTFASSGTGALIHLTGELFKQAARIDMTHVPYKGSAQILPDLLEGRVDMALDSLVAYLPHLRSGKARVLAVASTERSPLLPDTPTMAEIGLPAVLAATDYALYAPAGTQREAIALFNREVNAVIQMEEVRAKLAGAGIVLRGGTPESLAAELADELRKWDRVIKAANVKLE